MHAGGAGGESDAETGAPGAGDAVADAGSSGEADSTGAAGTIGAPDAAEGIAISEVSFWQALRVPLELNGSAVPGNGR